MPWLVAGDRVIASADVARSRAERRRGLLGRDHLDGALVIERARSVHSIGMRFDLDVAFVAADGEVLEIVHLPRHRLTRPRRRAAFVVEAAAGSFERWRVRPGDVVEVRS